MKLIDGVFTAYVGKLLVVRFLLLLVVISIIWQMLDLLNQSDNILAAKSATTNSLFLYIRLSIPAIISQFVPFAVLLSIVFTLTSLSMSSEITVMRAAGMSVNRVLFPIGLVCLFIAIGHFVFQETIAVNSAQRLEYWRANGYEKNLPPNGASRVNIRLAYENSFIEAKSAERMDDRTSLNDVTIYKRDKALVDEVLVADAAIFENNQWYLENARHLNPMTQQVLTNSLENWPVGFNPDFLFSLTLNPDRTNLGELWSKITQLRNDRVDTRSEMTSFLGRFSRPLGTLIMPLLGAIAGFGIHRQGVMLARAINGSLLGFSYFVVENISLALGKLGVLPAIIGAFFPFLLFAVVGFAIVLAMESK